MKMIRKYLPHVTIILSAMFVLFSILNRFNEAMNFLANDISQVLIVLLAVSAFINACFVIADDRRNNK